MLDRPLRIAMVGGFAWEPLGTIRLRTFPLAAVLARSGHQVRIFLTPYDNPNYSGKEFVKDGVTITNTEVGSRLGYPFMLGSLVRRIQRFRPDIVHVFKPKGFAGAAATMLLLLNYRVVTDCDDWEGWGGWNDVKPYPWIVKEYIDKQEKWLIRQSHAVTVASRALEKRAIDAKAKGTVTLLPNCGVSFDQVPAQYRVAAMDRLQQRSALGIPLEKRVIFYNGHFEPADDLDFLCRVCANAAERTGAMLLFTGEGPELGKVQSYFAQRGTDIKYLPRLPYEDFLRSVYVSDVTIFPYPDNPLHRSKCSTRIIDYMVMARPVLTTTVGMNSEYIVNGESGILTPPGDESCFENELVALVQDHDRCSYLGRNAQRRIRERFVWDGQPLQSSLQIYEEVIRNDRRRRI